MPHRPSELVEDLQQRKPFSTRAEEAVVAVMRTSALLRRAFAQRVARFGISPSQYNVLRILRGAGNGGLPTLAVRDRLVEEAPGITRLINKLEIAGLVTRERSRRDRRTVYCHITEKGLALLDQMDEMARETHALVDAGLPDLTEQERLIQLLTRVRSGIS